MARRQLDHQDISGVVNVLKASGVRLRVLLRGLLKASGAASG